MSLGQQHAEEAPSTRPSPSAPETNEQRPLPTHRCGDSVQFSEGLELPGWGNNKVFFSPPMPPHVLMNFRGFPPGCGDSIADF